MPFEKKTPKLLIRFYCKLSFLLNILTLVFCTVYFIIPVYSFLYDIFGTILLCSWLLNIFILYLGNHYLVKTNPIARKINIFSYYYIIFFIIGILLMISGILLLNILITGDLLAFGIILFYLDILASVLGIAMLGMYLAILTSANLETKGVWNFE